MLFTNSVRLGRTAGRELAKRAISKTSSTPNSDAITSRKLVEFQMECDIITTKGDAKRWLRNSKYNNNRALSTVQSKSVPQQAMPMGSKEQSREFMAVFPDIVRDLTDAGRHTDIPEVTKWYTKVLQYNVPNGKKSRGLSLVTAYKMLEDPELQTPENVRLANILGWCVEMFQGFLLIQDDIMDSSEMRRGVPCWYKLPEVGMNGINDAILLEHGLYAIIKKYFSNHPMYVPALELFHDVTLKTSMGQSLDMLSIREKNLDSYTMKRYNAIAKYKTSYYTFQLPVTLAMYLANKFDPEMHRQAKTILMEIGHFFQVQDDFLDCFGNPEVTGKTCNDIREGKCSWLVVVALQRATPAQRKVLDENYGKSDPAAAEAVRNLYEELCLPNTFAIYEEESYNLIKTHIQQLSKGLPHNLFFKFMEKIYKRES